MEYTYTHTTTEAGTGYFSCVPDASLSFAEGLRLLEEHPLDTFLHTSLLRSCLAMPREQLASLVKSPDLSKTSAEAALLSEAVSARTDLADLLPFLEDARGASPLLHREADQDRIFWNGVIRRNREWFAPIPDEAKERAAAFGGKPAGDTFSVPTECRESDPSPSSLYRDAADALLEAGFLSGREMRHEASLAPVALLREWNLAFSVGHGRNTYTVKGTATAYGRGLSLERARLSCIMEIVERASSYVSVQDGQVLDRLHPLPLVTAETGELAARGRAFLDPDRLALEVPARKASYVWVPAQDPDGREVLVPGQAVFLFANYDEPELFSAGTSTGLASGVSPAQAKLSALLECIERDAEAVVPNEKERVFSLKSRNPSLQALFDAYAERSIWVQFQEKTTEFGIPVYQAFVRTPDGLVHSSHACKLSAQAAILSALTEVPWPCSFVGKNSSPTGAGFAGRPARYFEDFPSCTLPAEEGLRLVEGRLSALGYTPLYVDLTRDDLQFPVVRALVPGLEVSADCDPKARPPVRFIRRCPA